MRLINEIGVSSIITGTGRRGLTCAAKISLPAVGCMFSHNPQVSIATHQHRAAGLPVCLLGCGRPFTQPRTYHVHTYHALKTIAHLCHAHLQFGLLLLIHSHKLRQLGSKLVNLFCSAGMLTLQRLEFLSAFLESLLQLLNFYRELRQKSY